MFFIFKQASLNLSWASPKVLKMGHLRPLFRTWSFTNKYYIFVTNYCQKLSIQSPVLGLEPTTSPPINTRPGIPPILAQRVCLPSPVANQAQSIFNNSSLKFRFTFLIGCLKEQDRFRPIRMLQFWCQLNVYWNWTTQVVVFCLVVSLLAFNSTVLSSNPLGRLDTTKGQDCFTASSCDETLRDF